MIPAHQAQKEGYPKMSPMKEKGATEASDEMVWLARTTYGYGVVDHSLDFLARHSWCSRTECLGRGRQIAE